MDILKGIAASPGIATGIAFMMEREDIPVRERFIPEDHVEAEAKRFEEAVDRAKEEVERLRDRVTREIGESSAAIFSAHGWVLSDPELHEEVLARIRGNRFTAEYAIDRALQKFIKRLRAVGDTYLAQRIQDLEDIERRLIRLVQGARDEQVGEMEGPVVVVAHTLSPSQTVSLDRSKVVGIAVDKGGRASHAAILARDLGIPAVVGLETASTDVGPGETVIIDGRQGVLIVSPDRRTRTRYKSLSNEYVGYERMLTEESHLPSETSDGTSVTVLGNIEFPEEIPSVVEHGAEGIGLYRTEFLYLGSGKMPTEEEHLDAYRAALEFLGGRPILIRTLDIGADKLAPGPVAARNGWGSSLGCRSIRLCQARPDIFRTQLRAILRVSVDGNVKCMLPMISMPEELSWAKGVVEEVKEELSREGTPFDPNLEVGVMIEVPAAVVMADVLAREAAFFSIGTNDLIQYTLAVDRTDERVATLFTPADPSVLRLIRMVIEAGERHGLPVSMCGEMAGDPIFVELLLGMGLRAFSVAPARVPEVKKIVRSVSLEEAQGLARDVLELTTHDEIMRVLVARLARFGPSQLDGRGSGPA